MSLNYTILIIEALSVLFLVGSCILVSLNDLTAMVFCLVFTLFTGIWFFMLFDAEYALLVFLIVYLGAVVVLFVFVLMILKKETDWFYKEIGTGDIMLFLSLVLSSSVCLNLLIRNFVAHATYQYMVAGVNLDVAKLALTLTETNVEKVGELFYTVYAIPLVSIGYLFVVVIIGALVVSQKDKKGCAKN